MNESLATQIEINSFIKLFYELEKDENLGYSLCTNLIDFFAQYYSGKDKMDERVLETLISLLGSPYTHIQERVEKAITKLMVRNYKNIRKYLLLLLNKDITDTLKEKLDNLINTTFSPIYFDFSKIREPQEELEEILNTENTSTSEN